MRKLVTFALLVVTLSAFILSGCAQPAPAPKPTPSPTTPTPTPHPEVKLDVWGGPFGGTPYITGFAIVDALNKTHPWLRATIIETKGSWDNTLNSDKDKARMPYVVAFSDYAVHCDIINGVAKSWNDTGRPPANPADRLIMGMYGNSAQLTVTFDPNLKRGKDLIGKKMAGWTRGSAGYTTLELMLEEWGITEKDLKSYDGMELKARNDALKDGLVDAIHLAEPYIPGKPTHMSANLAELMAVPKPLFNIPITKEEADMVAAKYKQAKKFFYPWGETAAGHYNKDWGPQGTHFIPQLFWVYKEMPQEIQYEIAKTLIEQNDAIIAKGGAAAVMVPAVVVGALPIASESEMAPGALKYYKEKGLWVQYRPRFLPK